MRTLTVWAGILSTILILLAHPPDTHAQSLPGGTNAFYALLDSWSFYDNTNWTDDYGDFPISFTNLGYSYLGNGASLVVDTNFPAWLQYNVVEADGSTNFTVDSGTVTFWFAPSSWSSSCDTNGGSGPGEYGRLFEVGGYTPDSSYGWWSLYVDPAGNNLYFSAQTNDLSSNSTTYLTAPIDWVTNYFHFVAVTYCDTNTALYLDGVLVTNGPPMTIYPGPDVLTNGLFIGSDNSGVYQAHGMFNTMTTYDSPLDAATIADIFSSEYFWYMVSPWNQVMFQLSPAPSVPSYTQLYDAVSGIGNLSDQGVTGCTYGTNIYNVWLTNVVAFTAGDGTMTIQFTILGGLNGMDNVPYDVFANTVLDFSTNTSRAWVWEGQGYHCHTYRITEMPKNAPLFIILGTPIDSDGDGLTNAFEKLVTKTNPYNPDTSGDGISDSDEYLLGLNPLASNPAVPANPAITICPQ